MNSNIRFLIANAILFQVGWFVCLMGGDSWAVVFTGIALAGHFWWSPSRQADLLAMILAVVIGGLHDCVLLALGYIRFVETDAFPPFWLMAVWAMFGLTLNHSLLWVYRRFWLSAALGIIAGPLSYLAGVKLSTAEWSAPLGQLLPVIAFMWLLVLPVHRFIYLRLSNVFFIRSSEPA